jgi:hypothetical protein
MCDVLYRNLKVFVYTLNEEYHIGKPLLDGYHLIFKKKHAVYAVGLLH